MIAGAALLFFGLAAFGLGWSCSAGRGLARELRAYEAGSRRGYCLGAAEVMRASHRARVEQERMVIFSRN